MQMVFPRDAFNLAQVWKSVGFLMLAVHEKTVNVSSEYDPQVTDEKPWDSYFSRRKMPDGFVFEYDDKQEVEQDIDIGYLTIQGVNWICGSCKLTIEHRYNCKDKGCLSMCTAVDGFNIMCTAVDGIELDEYIDVFESDGPVAVMTNKFYNFICELSQKSSRYESDDH